MRLPETPLHTLVRGDAGRILTGKGPEEYLRGVPLLPSSGSLAGIAIHPVRPASSFLSGLGAAAPKPGGLGYKTTVRAAS